MGCFLACFGAPKDGKRRRSTRRRLARDQVCEQYRPRRLSPSLKQLPEEVRPLQLSVSLEKLPEEVPTNPVLDFRDVGQLSSPRKRVTFDLNVKIYEDVTFQEDQNSPLEADQQKEETRLEDKPQNEGTNSVLSSLGAYPSNHRYENCASSDEDDSEDGREEEEEDDYEDCDFDDKDDLIDGTGNGEEESFDSYFSLPMDKERETYKEVTSVKAICGSPDRKPALLSKQNARDRSHYVHSVLNPVENISQWKEVKARAPPKHPKKENINLEQESNTPISLEPSFKLSKPRKSFNSNPSSNFHAKQDVSVDTSLSNWLPPIENTPHKGPFQKSSPCQSNSSVSFDDRPILGALTVEELKQSASSSPRKSPSRSPDDIPILGTVGSYWNHTDQQSDSSSSKRSSSGAKGIPNTTSKYREDKQVNWHATPFEERLERVLNRGAAEAYSSYPPSAC